MSARVTRIDGIRTPESAPVYEVRACPTCDERSVHDVTGTERALMQAFSSNWCDT